VIITDSQVHVWEAHRPDRPWDPDEADTPVFLSIAGAHPHREAPIGAEEMVSMMDAAGVDRAIIVPPSPTGDDNLTALEAAAAYPDRFRVMGRFAPQAPDARERLEQWLDQPHVCGIRMTFHKPKWGPWLDDGSLDWYWAACERLGIPLMLLVPRRLESIARIAHKHPGLTLIIDHMGRRSELRDDACFADLDELLAMARLPNVMVKVAAAPCYSTAPYPYANLRPFLEQIVHAFGPGRSFWGSDVSRLPCSYRQCVEHFTQELDFLHGADLELVMGKALSKVLRWPEPATKLAPSIKETMK
jgi:predicted TIM-barrel fold metal-dependent hydrolase